MLESSQEYLMEGGWLVVVFRWVGGGWGSVQRGYSDVK